MTRTTGAAGALLVIGLALASGPVAAQQSGPFSLPAGVVRLRAGLEYAHFDSRFARDGTEPLAAPLLRPLTGEVFAPVGALQEELNRFFAATDAGGEAVRAGPENLLLGTPDVDLSVDIRSVPLALEVGVLPRVQIGIELPVFRTELQLERFGLTGATVGPNPNPAANAAALAALGAEFAALGEAALLPLAGSPLGQELQQRVLARGGGDLQLPRAVPDTLLPGILNRLLAEELGIEPLATGSSEWEVGDAVVGIGVRLLGNMRGEPFPTDTASARYQLFLTGSARLPTGVDSELAWYFGQRPELGLSGWGVGIAGDLFSGDRFWLSGAARASVLRDLEVERRLAPPALPLSAALPPQRVRWSPGTTLHLWVSPRFRLTEAIALGAGYEVLRRGEIRYELLDEGAGDASVLDRSGGTVQRLGGSIHFSTLPAYLAGARLLPVEVSLSYQAAVAGAAGAVVDSAMRVQISLLRRLWGR